RLSAVAESVASTQVKTSTRGIAPKSAQDALVDGHTDGGVHPHFAQRGNLSPRTDAPRCDDRMRSCVAELPKPREIRAGHRSFTAHVSAQERGAKGFELRENVLGAKGNRAAPAACGDLTFRRVEGDDDSSAGHRGPETAKEREVDV